MVEVQGPVKAENPCPGGNDLFAALKRMDPGWQWLALNNLPVEPRHHIRARVLCAVRMPGDDRR